jgi:hypothetical protein
MRLVYDESGDAQVQVGDVVHVRGIPYTILALREPHKPSSTGRVICQSMTEEKWLTEWFPNVVHAHWIERDDQ